MISTMKKRRSKRPRMGTSRGNDEHFSSSNNSRDDDLYLEEEEDMANCLILLAQGRHHDQQLPPLTAVVNKELYSCKTCNRIFPSFQALGGHRASHNRLIKTSSPPILPSSSENQDDLTTLSLQIHYPMVSNKNKMHECSICGAEFTSGQALGGHMRRHRPLPPTSSDGGPEESPSQETKKARNLMSFDLNLPAEEERRESSFPAAFAASKERVIVFSNSPLVDCHY